MLDKNLKLFNESIILINSSNLYSSILDAVHLIHLFNDHFNMRKITIITDSDKANDSIKLLCPNSISNINIFCETNLIDSFGEAIKQASNDVLITLSSHGFAVGDKNFIKWNGKKIYDFELRRCIVNNIKNTLDCLILVDTCQSGTMFNLNYQTKDLKYYKPENPSDCKLNIVCIGAVDDSEYDADDVSNYGFGGGLTSGLVDYTIDYAGIEEPTIRNFFIYYKKRVSLIGVHPVLSFNNIIILC